MALNGIYSAICRQEAAHPLLTFWYRTMSASILSALSAQQAWWSVSCTCLRR